MRFGIRETIFLLLLLGLPVAAYFFVFQPRNVQIAEARADIQKKQAKLEQLERATTSFSDMDEEIQKLSQAIELYEQKLPAQKDEQVILREVSELAKTHDLKIRSWRTDKIIRSANYSEQALKMEIFGDFDGFYEFLLELERLPRITRTPVMTLKKDPKDEEGVMEADVVLNIYFEGDSAGQQERKS